MEKEFRVRVTTLSFLLTVFVIWLHAGESLISDIPGQIAVPGFFMLSGVLFFRDFGAGEKSAAALLREKLLRRLRTLLLPYLLWNFLYFLVYFVTGRAELTELFRAVFLYSCNPVFWYLFQLILITALTPLLYLLLRKKLPALLFLAAVFLAAVFYAQIHAGISFSYCNEDALFYYSLGAFFSLRGKRCAAASAHSESSAAGQKTGSCLTPGKLRPLLLSFLLFLFSGFLGTILPAELMNVSVIGLRCAGVLCLWTLLCLLKLPEPLPWMKITFFIYAVHYLLIRLVWAAEAALGLNGSAAANILTYLLMPAFCTAASYGIYLLMKRFTPRFLSLLTGGRMS